MTIAILDPCAPRAYTTRAEDLKGLGGTEMTIAAVAERLADYFPVEVHQSARQSEDFQSGIRFRPLQWKAAVQARSIIVINSWKTAVACRKANPDARILLWLHLFPGRHNRKMASLLRQASVEIVCVSNSHARIVRRFLGAKAPKINVVYNSIPDDLGPRGVKPDRNLLVFASAPHKGLAEVYRNFEIVRQSHTDLRLAVADPGYMHWDTGPIPEGVETMGRQTKGALWSTMERALCLFYPQTTFAETFGIVIAEANGVGCPALLHTGLGANDEVASSRSQCIDCTRPELVLETIAKWRGARPLVRARNEFRLSKVVGQWLELVGEPRRSSPPGSSFFWTSTRKIKDIA